MSITSILGLLMALGVFIFGLWYSSPNLLVFWDGISVFVVLGGTIAATAISFKLEKIFFLLKVFLIRVLKDNQKQNQEIIGEIIKFAEAFKKNDEAKIDGLLKSSKDFFLKEGIELVKDGFLEPNKILEILDKRKDNVSASYMVDANKFKVIGKYPPAFGMLGTTIGMIVLLGNLGGADAAKMIGPAMGICLITTLYGCALSNFLIIPIAENLSMSARELKVKNTIICEGIRLIIEKENPIVIAEELNSFLLPGERVDWKKYVTPGKA